MSHSRPNILLISATAAHVLDELFAFLESDAPLVGDDLGQHIAHLSRHVRRIAADVEIGFLGQEVVDEGRVLLHQVLDVDFLAGGFAGEGVEDREIVAERCFEGL